MIIQEEIVSVPHPYHFSTSIVPPSKKPRENKGHVRTSRVPLQYLYFEFDLEQLYITNEVHCDINHMRNDLFILRVLKQFYHCYIIYVCIFKRHTYHEVKLTIQTNHLYHFHIRRNHLNNNAFDASLTIYVVCQ